MRALVCGWGEACAAGVRVLHKRGHELRVLSTTKQCDDFPLDLLCKELSIPYFFTDSNKEVFSYAKEYQPDVLISLSYRKKLMEDVLNIPTKGAINFHPSLLPKHRGCFSGFWVIFDGDDEAGVTCHHMTKNFDDGHILHQEKIAVGADDTAKSLYKRLIPVTSACVSAAEKLFMENGEQLPAGDPQPKVEHSEVYHYRKLPFDGVIQPEWPLDKVDRFIRANHFPPHTPAQFLVNGQR